MRESSEAGALTAESWPPALYKMLRLKAARFLGRYRTVPDEQWERATGLFKSIFGESLAGGSGFYPQVNAWVVDVRRLDNARISEDCAIDFRNTGGPCRRIAE